MLTWHKRPFLFHLRGILQMFLPKNKKQQHKQGSQIISIISCFRIRDTEKQVIWLISFSFSLSPMAWPLWDKHKQLPFPYGQWKTSIKIKLPWRWLVLVQMPHPHDKNYEGENDNYDTCGTVISQSLHFHPRVTFICKVVKPSTARNYN